MTSKHHSITPGWLRSSPGDISSPVSDRFGSPILARYLAMNVDSTWERMWSQKDRWVGESECLRETSLIRVERVIATRSPCLRLEMARSLLAAVFFAEAFAMAGGNRERRCNRGKPSVILPGTAHEPHPRLVLLVFLPKKFAFPPQSQQDRRFEVEAKHAHKYAQLRASLKVRGKVTYPLLPHAHYPLWLCPPGPWHFDPSSTIV